MTTPPPTGSLSSPIEDPPIASGPGSGRRAGGPPRWWWTPLRVALGLTLLLSVLAYLQKEPCLTHPVGKYNYTHLCYTDTWGLYSNEGLNARLNSQDQVTGRISVPYRDHAVEYPPVMGGLMWLAAEGTVLLHPGEPPDVGIIHRQTFFNLTVLGLALCALISTWTVFGLAGRKRAWDATLMGLSPVLLMSAFDNWDLAAVAVTGLGLWVWSRGSPFWGGALLGVGIATKLYPVFVVLAILMLCARAGVWRSAAKLIGGAVAGTALCYLPAILISKNFPFPSSGCAPIEQVPGWRWFFTLSKYRPADFGGVWVPLQHTFAHDAFGRYLGRPVGCGKAPASLNFAEELTIGLLVVGVAVLVALAPRRPRVAQIAFLLVIAFTMFNKVDSVQYALWLVPLAVLARPRWPSLLVWQLSEVVLGAANYLALVPRLYGSGGLSFTSYLWILTGRDVILLGLAGLVIREALRPGIDVVRRDGVDDPAGGVLDGAPDGRLRELVGAGRG